MKASLDCTASFRPSGTILDPVSEGEDEDEEDDDDDKKEMISRY